MLILKNLFYFLIFPGLLFLTIAGCLLHFIDRKITALVQSRIGPPWYQGFADFFKLLYKETLVPKNANTFLFFLAPLISFSGTLLASIILLNILFGFYQSFIGDVIVIIYLLIFPSLGIILAGSASSNPIASVGASRESKLMLGYELCLLISFAIVILKNNSLFINSIISNQPVIYSVSGLIAFLTSILCIHAKLGFVPFDIAEAETELIAGPFIEYSGPPLALFYLSKFILFLFLPIFLVTMFWYSANIIFFILKFLIIITIMILIKNTNPRLRIDQAVKFFWIKLFVLNVISLILALIGKYYNILWL